MKRATPRQCYRQYVQEAVDAMENAYHCKWEDMEHEDRQAALASTITNLRHAADWCGLDIDLALHVAYTAYLEERKEVMPRER